MMVMSDNLDFSILHVPKNNDKVYRDSLCMAYVCAIMDLPMSDFEVGVKSTLKRDGDKEHLIQLAIRDLEIRLNRLLQ